MTDCRTVRVPRTSTIAEWEERRHASEVEYWAKHFDEFVKRLPSLRRNRLGDMGAARLMDDVLEAIEAAEGTLSAWEARERLLGCWGDRREAARRGP